MEVGKFEINPQAFGVIMQGLGELPLKLARPVHDELMRQAQAMDAGQQQKPAPVAEPVPEPLPAVADEA